MFSSEYRIIVGALFYLEFEPIAVYTHTDTDTFLISFQMISYKIHIKKKKIN